MFQSSCLLIASVRSTSSTPTYDNCKYAGHRMKANYLYFSSNNNL